MTHEANEGRREITENRYMQQTYHRIREGTWIKRPRLANMISER
jgi:hypothetical protein